jgi:carotenoid 1,2-hydratase
VERSGYAWWYLDAFSDDHRYGLTIIAFIGSVFSPYYAAKRRWGNGHALSHCALNVALYGPNVRRWAMTERCRRSLERGPDHLAIGPSALSWDGTRLRVEFDESAPLTGARIKGSVLVEPEILCGFVSQLGSQGQHEWQPVAPRARVDVRLESPALSWSGLGYFDMNRGNEPLEAGFKHWNWSRACVRDGAAIVYDVTRPDGGKTSMGLHIKRDGSVEPTELRQSWRLPRTMLWQMPRQTRCDRGRVAEVVKTLEDTPFYSRSVLAATLLGERTVAMHESLSLQRFKTRWVQTLLPYRMPRAAL